MSQETIKKMINVLIAIMVVAGIGMGIFFLLGRQEAPSETASTQGATTQEGVPTGISPEAAQLIQFLGKLQTIDLNHSVVERNDFNLLKDIKTAIPVEPVGTTVPFNSL